MSYKAIYRRFRPNNYNDLIGQENVVKILQNQIKNNNIAHAYLFSGIRGTGKTSAAKIFARAVNCLNPKDGNPCNKCEICRGIINEEIMDIVEIDAASNNKVDDIRELKESSNYPPSKTRYKVYIVDEVHMLSKGAFNAFLKTLEEPPNYMIFILATTEENRIPSTILSRCQRFEFKRINSLKIVENMEKICNELGVEFEKSALNLIARNSDGGMRDALSILDQCLVNEDNYLSLKNVIDSIGTVDNEFLRNIVKDIIDKNSSNIVYKFDELTKTGKDYIVFLKELISFFRDLMILKTGVNYEDILELSDEDISGMKELLEEIGNNEIINYIEELIKVEEKIKNTNQPRIILEVSLIKLCDIEDRESLISRIENLEKIVESGEIRVKNEKSIDKRDIKESKKLIPPIKRNDIFKNNKEDELIEKKEEQEELIDAKELSFDVIIEKWDDFLKFLRKKRPSIAALLLDAEISNFSNSILTVNYGKNYGFHKEAISRSENRENLKEVLKEFFKSKIELDISMEEEEIIKESSESVENNEEYFQEVLDIFGNDKVTIE
ncbi:MAG: DNA polymerase III subunit gamma/tau [Andreesenia angusta]|nr:DNA polymerase III subunit gamma/tau [Andreesenia angusta]